MDKFTLFLQKLDILQNVTDEEVQKTETLLRVYGPTHTDRDGAHLVPGGDQDRQSGRVKSKDLIQKGRSFQDEHGRVV